MQARFKLAIPAGSTAQEEVNKARHNVSELLTRVKDGDVVVLPLNTLVIQRQTSQRTAAVAALIAAPALLPVVEGEVPPIEFWLEFNGEVENQDLIKTLIGDDYELGEPEFYQADDRRLAWNESMVSFIDSGKAQLTELIQFVVNDLGTQGYIHSAVGQAAYKQLPPNAKAKVDESIELQNKAGALLNDIDMREGEPEAPKLEAADDEYPAPALNDAETEVIGERASGAPETEVPQEEGQQATA